MRRRRDTGLAKRAEARVLEGAPNTCAATMIDESREQRRHVVCSRAWDMIRVTAERGLYRICFAHATRSRVMTTRKGSRVGSEWFIRDGRANVPARISERFLWPREGGYRPRYLRPWEGAAA